MAEGTQPAAGNETERRVKDTESARKIHNGMRKAAEKRLEVYARVSNQLEGGRPFDPAVLQRDGQAYACNVNFGDAEAAFDRTHLPYWKMAHDVPNKIAVTVRTGSNDAEKWAKAFQESYDDFLDDWGVDYFVNFMLGSGDFVKFGPGYMTWRNGKSPRYRHARVEKVFFPKDAKTNPDEWEVVAIEDALSVSEIYKLIRNKKSEEQSEYGGWNATALRKALVIAKDSGGNPERDATTIQDELVSNDLTASSEWKPVEIVRLFVREFDGSICCYIFTKDGGVSEFLYQSKSYADSFQKIIGTLFFSVGRGGLIHTIKGFSVKNFYLSMLQNRMKSRIMDAASFAMNLNMQRAPGAPEEAPPIEVYPGVNVLPEGLTQLSVYPHLAQGQAVVQMLERNQAENNAMYKEQRQQIENTDTATQANLLAAMSSEMGSAVASIFLAQLGMIHGECFRRLRIRGSDDPDAVAFVKRCKERGIPDKVIFEAEVKVKSGASASTASAAIRDGIFRELLALSNTPGFNRRWIIEAYVAHKLGASAVNKALLPDGEQSEPQARKMAMLENSAMGSGLQLPVDPNEAHSEHIEEHLRPLEQIAGAYKQGQQITPEHVAALLTAIPHVQTHFEFLQQDETRKGAYKAVWPRFSAVASIANGIATRLQKERQGQPPQS